MILKTNILVDHINKLAKSNRMSSITKILTQGAAIFYLSFACGIYLPILINQEPLWVQATGPSWSETPDITKQAILHLTKVQAQAMILIALSIAISVFYYSQPRALLFISVFWGINIYTHFHTPWPNDVLFLNERMKAITVAGVHLPSQVPLDILLVLAGLIGLLGDEQETTVVGKTKQE
ncbi:hypothetical protein SARC_00473 [Sphaeroforma arctica JP610]|uniref:Uncharacterized protein n=1 Tax=Sphaeroforma arctica JP610 TaxID=667725 RepID=A0A0L0GEZ3_9EUKA|nr:hypothetical protein SARC_00473 [Sphaeroforma arctica JP610]KNC87436.1 hypothetical protein SARC_00473 [Sphaeroforma arctica JP610]|eukprot:XP_014161338.1 hypothetical protein SARC_00473 [Sphaeroforma arctica JP610]